TERQRRTQDRSDVAGVADAMQVDAQRTARQRPAHLVDADRARAGREAADGVQQRLLDLLPLKTAAGGDEQVHRRPAGLRGGRDEILALGHEAPALVALAPAREP